MYHSLVMVHIEALVCDRSPGNGTCSLGLLTGHRCQYSPYITQEQAIPPLLNHTKDIPSRTKPSVFFVILVRTATNAYTSPMCNRGIV